MKLQIGLALDREQPVGEYPGGVRMRRFGSDEGRDLRQGRPRFRVGKADRRPIGKGRVQRKVDHLGHHDVAANHSLQHAAGPLKEADIVGFHSGCGITQRQLVPVGDDGLLSH